MECPCVADHVVLGVDLCVAAEETGVAVAFCQDLKGLGPTQYQQLNLEADPHNEGSTIVEGQVV